MATQKNPPLVPWNKHADSAAAVAAMHEEDEDPKLRLVLPILLMGLIALPFIIVFGLIRGAFQHNP